MTEADESGSAPAGSGHPAVDEVLAISEQLDGLDERPVDEHVEVYEHAHTRLREALDRARDGQA